MGAFTVEGFDLGAFVRATLAEDLGEGWPGGGHDVTSESVIPADAEFSGVMDSRDAITVCGLPIAAAFFRVLDPAMTIARAHTVATSPTRSARARRSPCRR
mgnify:CR=1 FL=1